MSTPDDTVRDTQAATNEVVSGDVAWTPPDRYEVAEVLGRGGMGEVTLAYDLQIGRGIAIKRMRGRSPSENAVSRFLREAKIQARLDHPAIVPVHEIGRDDAGQPYFTMKRLVGKTLHDALADRSLTRQQLLRIVIDVCLAVGLAHTRSVVHRDLKPANIMMGDFGEVYVLDWGVARITGETRAGTDITTLDDGTQSGALLGTPGYMAPEQVRCEDIGAAADVYALGAILFEVLAGEPLHPPGTAALATTLMTPTAAPASRAPDRSIPPELDALCVAALAESPASRPSARRLADEIQRYLDGDRDLEARRKIAARELATARDALARDDRAAAMQAAGRAMALDPESEAAAFVTKLMLEPPRELPAEVEARVVDRDREMNSVGARQGALSLAAMIGFIPLFVWNGVAKPSVVIALYVGLALVVAQAWRSHKLRRFEAPFVFAAAVTLMAILSRFIGSLLLIPSVVTMLSMAFMHQRAVNARPVVSIAVMLGALFLPLVLEAAGVLDSTWSIENGQIVSKSTALVIREGSTLVLILAAYAAFVVVAALFARRVALALRNANRQLELQAWHLRKLLPSSSTD